MIVCVFISTNSICTVLFNILDYVNFFDKVTSNINNDVGNLV